MLNKLAGTVRRCIDDYDMIKQGETVAVGVSGGKDSLVLLCALASLREYHPKKFKLHAVTLEMGFKDMDFSGVKKLCKNLKIPYTQEHSNIAAIVFDQRKEKNPCSLCAKMRRAALCGMVKNLGIMTLALAHHYDDAVETFLLSLLYEGRINCFQPVTHLSRTDITQIRPMLYTGEKAIQKFVELNNLPVVHNTCPMNGVSKREDVKTLLKTLGKTHPDIKSKIFGAVKRLPLEGWDVGYRVQGTGDRILDIKDKMED